MDETRVLIERFGGLSYAGVFGLSLLANIFIPVPEEIVLLMLGYFTHAGHIDIFITIPIVIAGLLTSDFIIYTLSRRGNRLITYFYNRFFARRLERRQVWLGAHIEKVIFYSRFLMQLRFLGPFMAGQTNVSKRKFLTYELAALVIYVPLFLWLGWYFRSRIDHIIEGIGVVRNIILIIIGITVVLSISRSIFRRVLKKPATPNE